jgi:hypothetical protein
MHLMCLSQPWVNTVRRIIPRMTMPNGHPTHDRSHLWDLRLTACFEDDLIDAYQGMSIRSTSCLPTHRTWMPL